MTCNACGEKPKNTAKDFTKAVIEINNPETLVLLRKVVIPASMGTEEQVPAAIGKYHNVILKYEANRHVYLYSSDGIPTLLEMDVPQEVWDSIDELQEEIDEIKNNPDVVDIVDTYADLESYDTSKLGDKDVIRVLNDETHDGESTYYRWNLDSQTWTFIGGLGPYYTKDETNTLIESAKGSAKELTSEDYNWPTANPDGVAVWSLPTGMYRAPNGVNIYNDSATSGSGGNRIFFVNSDLPGSNSVIYYSGTSIALSVVNKSTGSIVLDTSTLLTSQVVDALTSTATKVPLSANQGKVLNDMIIDNVGMARVLTADDYNWNSTSSSATEPYDSIALWRLPSGQYHIDNNSMKVFTSIAATELIFPNQHMYLINKEPSANASILVTPYSAAATSTKITFYVTAVANGQPSGGTTVNGMIIPWGGDIPTVVQDTGASTTDVMSQKAVRDLIFNAPFNPDEKNNIQIGYQASSYNNSVAIGNHANSGRINSSAVVIGNRATASQSTSYAIAIGEDSNAGGHGTICIGKSTSNPNKGCIMLGAYCGNYPAGDGVMCISTSNTDYGYNNSQYRLLTGVYDPQDAHDAATKGYVDTNSVASATFWGQSVNNGAVNGSLIFEGNPATDGTDISLESDGSLTIHTGSGGWVTFHKSNGLSNDVNFNMASLVDIADGTGDTHAVNVRQLNKTLLVNGTTAPDSNTVGKVGSLCSYVTSGTGHLAICTAVNAGNPPTYTWQTLI